jgi:hypothetical protein
MQKKLYQSDRLEAWKFHKERMNLLSCCMHTRPLVLDGGCEKITKQEPDAYDLL